MRLGSPLVRYLETPFAPFYGLSVFETDMPVVAAERILMIDRIDHIVLNCRNVEVTAAWYERALGFKRVAYTSPGGPGERIALKFGAHKFNLRQTGDSSWETCKVDAPGSLDLCFITEGSLKPVVARLNTAGIPITVGPVPRTGALGPMTSIYCEDPDGNLVEVATYSPNPMS